MARNNHSAVGEDGFFEKYCKLYQCRPEQFEKSVLRQCLFPSVRPLAGVIRLLDRDFFKPDLDMITETKEATRISQIQAIINFYSVQPEEQDFARRQLKMRISKTRLIKLASEVFKNQPVK